MLKYSELVNQQSKNNFVFECKEVIWQLKTFLETNQHLRHLDLSYN